MMKTKSGIPVDRHYQVTFIEEALIEVGGAAQTKTVEASMRVVTYMQSPNLTGFMILGQREDGSSAWCHENEIVTVLDTKGTVVGSNRAKLSLVWSRDRFLWDWSESNVEDVGLHYKRPGCMIFVWHDGSWATAKDLKQCIEWFPGEIKRNGKPVAMAPLRRYREAHVLRRELLNSVIP